MSFVPLPMMLITSFAVGASSSFGMCSVGQRQRLVSAPGAEPSLPGRIVPGLLVLVFGATRFPFRQWPSLR